METVKTQRALWVKCCFIATALVLSLALVYCLCSSAMRKKFRIQELGQIAANSGTNQVDFILCLPTNYGASYLGISVEGSELMTKDQNINFVNSVMDLRFRIGMSSLQKTNEFYAALVLLRGNSSYYPIWQPDYGVLLTGIKPLPYAFTCAKSNDTGILHFDSNDNALEDGKLKLGVPYRMTMKIISPVNISNQFHVWLYSCPVPAPCKYSNARERR